MKIWPYFKLIRWSNLLIIAITQYALYYLLIRPVVVMNLVKMTLSHTSFALLCLSTLLVAAAGYIINDYYDVRIDQINKPEKVLVGKIIRRRTALMLHIIISSLGVLAAFLVAVTIHLEKLALLHVATAMILYKYSEVYKRKFLTGNLLISLLTALAVLIPLLYETLSVAALWSIQKETAGFLIKAVLMYAGFAFLVTFIREVVKDAEDLEGDLDSYCRTIPILMGTRRTKNLLLFLLGFVMLAIAGIQYLQIINGDKLSSSYLFLGVQIPALYSAWSIAKAHDKAGFAKASLWLKILMAGGVFSIVVFFIISQYL